MGFQMSSEKLMDLRRYKRLDKLMHVITFSIPTPLQGILLQYH